MRQAVSHHRPFPLYLLQGPARYGATRYGATRYSATRYGATGVRGRRPGRGAIGVGLGLGAFLALWVSIGAPAATALAGEGSGDPPVRSLRDLFNHEALLDRILERLYGEGRPVVRRVPPFELPPAGDGSGADPDGIPHADVYRATIDGPFFKGFFRADLGRNPDFCRTPLASPVARSSRITVEIWLPDGLDFSDLSSAVLFVQKSAAPNGTDPTGPQLVADQLSEWGVCSVVWWERDDYPAPDTGSYPDVLAVVRDDHDLAWLLGTGAIPEPPRAIQFPENTKPHDLAVEDFDGDGDVDVALACDGTDEVLVLANDGYGAFPDVTSFAAGAFPRAIVSASLNPDVDSHFDLVVANRNSGDVTILFGDGTGGFPTSSSIGAGAWPSDVVAEDFDEDGKIDLAISNGDSDDIHVLFGDGSGGFGSPTFLATDANPFAMAAADLDRDGHVDLVTANRDANTVTVFLGNGDGTFATATSHATGAAPSAIAVARLDVGLHPDVVVANNDSDDVTVLFSDGLGGFLPPTTIGAGDAPNAVAFGDLDDDGSRDILVGNRDSGDITALLGNGLGLFAEAPQSPFVAGAGVSALAVANVTDSTHKLSHAFGFIGDGELQEAGFDWMVYRRLNKGPAQSLTAEELRFDFRFAYAQAYLIATTFFQELLRVQFSSDPNVEDWLDDLRISYAGGSKRGGGVTTAVLQAGPIASVDPRNVRGLFISGYEGLDAGFDSGLHRYGQDWTHDFGPNEVEVFASAPCPDPACAFNPCGEPGCAEDSGLHPFEEFALWAHRMRDEPQSYAEVYTAQTPLNLALLDNVLIIDAVGTHDWINPLGSHSRFMEENPDLDVISLQRINRNHGSLVELEPDGFTATQVLHMRALYNMRWAGDAPMIDEYPLHRIRWVDLDTSGPEWVATVDLATTASGGFPEDYTVWVAFSDDRDFRRHAAPIESRPRTPCIDSDPNDETSDEDVFLPVTPSSVTPAGSQRVLTFTPPAEMASFTDPLTAVIVEAWFEGPRGTEVVDDLLVTTYPRFVDEDLYPASIEDCQGQDVIDVLHVNGDYGTANGHTVLVEASAAMTLGIDLPPAGGTGKFLALIEADAPSAGSITKLTNQLGNTCFPILLNDDAMPRARFNSIGKEDKVGSSEYFGSPIPDPGRAPTTFLDLPAGDPANFSVGQVFTLHGVILNPAVTGPKPASITNAIQIVIY